jgi:hypothetical protein
MAQARVEHVMKVVDADKELADHLKRAEEHLIAAVKLFQEKKAPKRTLAYMTRLDRAQELVTGLFREELVRIRGPIKMTVSVGKKRK